MIVVGVSLCCKYILLQCKRRYVSSLLQPLLQPYVSKEGLMHFGDEHTHNTLTCNIFISNHQKQFHILNTSVKERCREIAFVVQFVRKLP